MTKPRAVTVKEAKTMIGIGLTKFYEELNAGRLTAVKVGRRTLILVESIEKYLDNLPRRPTKGG